MPLHRIQVVIGLLCLIPGATRPGAQEPSYHAELTDKTSGYIIVINDSDKPIEAYRVSATCADRSGKREAMFSSYDVLVSPWKSGSQSSPQLDVIAPHSRTISQNLATPQPGVCDWQATIDGVIFSDGTYSGSPDVVQSMQAWRDGLATSLQFWADRLRTAQDPQSADVQDEAKKRSQEDESKRLPFASELPFTSPGGQYWEGRSIVDTDLAQVSQPTETDSARRALWRRQYPAQMVNQWVSKLDDDAAFKALDATFPLKPEMLQPPAPPKISDPCKPSPHK